MAGPGPMQERLVGIRDEARVAVGLAVDGDRGDAELPQRAHDADRDLAAVGDQDLVEHRHGVPPLHSPVGGHGAPSPTASLTATCRRPRALARDGTPRRRGLLRQDGVDRARERGELGGRRPASDLHAARSQRDVPVLAARAAARAC